MPRRSDDGRTETPGSPSISKKAAEPAQGLSIGQIFQMLAKHKWFIIGCTVLCALVSFIYVDLATPIYEATATIRIDQGRAGSLGLNGDLGGGGALQTADILHTELQVMQSDRIAIATLDSLSNEDFKRYSGADKQALQIPSESEALTPDQENLIGQFKLQLQVKQVLETQLVTISFRNPDARLSATIVNHFVAAYLRQNFDSRYGSVTQVTSWLSAQMQDLKQRAADAQQKLAKFQEQNNILATADSNNSNTTNDRLRLLNDSVAGAEANRIVKEAQLKAATAGGSNPAALASLFPNPKLQALQTQQGTLYAQYAQLSAKFGPKYTPLVQLKKQMQDIDAEIDRNAQDVRSRLTEEYTAAKNSETMLRSEYADQTQKAYALNRQQAELAALQAEGTASRQLYSTLQYKLQQAGIDAGLEGINTIPVDIARAPVLPAAPKKTLILAIGTILGLLIGIGSALIVEASADKVVGLEQLVGVTGYRPLVLIPHVRGNSSRSSGSLEPGMIALQNPLSKEAEPYRKLRNQLLQTAGGHELKTFLVTSARSGEGKSTVAANYAIVLAQTGAKVLLVDAELRRPSLNNQFAVSNDLGLSDCLDADTLNAHFMQPVSALPNLSFLASGKHSELPAEALASVKFQSLLEVWKNQFDYVVIKSAPLLPVADSLPLANWVDGVLIVTRQDVTRLKQVERVRNVLDHTDANVAGVIVNDATANSDFYGNDEFYGKEAYAS